MWKGGEGWIPYAYAYVYGLGFEAWLLSVGWPTANGRYWRSSIHQWSRGDAARPNHPTSGWGGGNGRCSDTACIHRSGVGPALRQFHRRTVQEGAPAEEAGGPEGRLGVGPWKERRGPQQKQRKKGNSQPSSWLKSNENNGNANQKTVSKGPKRFSILGCSHPWGDQYRGF